MLFLSDLGQSLNVLVITKRKLSHKRTLGVSARFCSYLSDTDVYMPHIEVLAFTIINALGKIKHGQFL